MRQCMAKEFYAHVSEDYIEPIWAKCTKPFSNILPHMIDPRVDCAFLPRPPSPLGRTAQSHLPQSTTRPIAAAIAPTNLAALDTTIVSPTLLWPYASDGEVSRQGVHVANAHGSLHGDFFGNDAGRELAASPINSPARKPDQPPWRRPVLWNNNSQDRS